MSRTLTLALFFLTSLWFCQAHALDAVTLQLKWHRQFQFAGYYAAKELGYYEEVGLDVSLIKPSTGEVLKVVVKNALDDFAKTRELRKLIGRHANNLNLLRKGEFCCRTLSEAKDLALLLADASLDPARTVNGYSELLINAIEHGNLGISYADKGRLLREGRWTEEVEARLQHPDYSIRVVNVPLEKTANASSVTISDQGNGFDWRQYVEFSPERAFDLHGRGIAMSRAISFDSLEYLGNGNSVVTTVTTVRSANAL